jgi:hypothetical protein
MWPESDGMVAADATRDRADQTSRAAEESGREGDFEVTNVAEFWGWKTGYPRRIVRRWIISLSSSQTF